MIKYLVAAFIILNIAALAFASFYFRPIPIVISEDTTLGVVSIQPAEAIEIAGPYLDEHGSHIVEGLTEEAKIFIVFSGEWYYVSQTNQPTENVKVYLDSSVQVNVYSGEIKL